MEIYVQIYIELYSYISRFNCQLKVFRKSYIFTEHMQTFFFIPRQYRITTVRTVFTCTTHYKEPRDSLKYRQICIVYIQMLYHFMWENLFPICGFGDLCGILKPIPSGYWGIPVYDKNWLWEKWEHENFNMERFIFNGPPCSWRGEHKAQNWSAVKAGFLIYKSRSSLSLMILWQFSFCAVNSECLSVFLTSY